MIEVGAFVKGLARGGIGGSSKEVLWKGCFDCVVGRFARDNFAQHDKGGGLDEVLQN